MARLIKKGATSQSVYVEVLDSSSTTGGRKTGLAYNTASLTAYYTRSGGNATAITLATLAAANSAWSSGGFKEVDATNAPGLYRLDVPDAAFAAGADSVVVTLKGASGMAQVSVEAQLVAWDPQDSVRGGLTALPNAAAEASGGLATLSAAQASNGTINVNVHRWLTGTPNALQSGRVDSYIGAVAAGVIAAAAFAANALDAVWSTTTRLLTAGTNIVLAKGTGITGFNDLSAAQVNAEADTALADAGVTTTVTGRIDAAISTRLATAGYTAPLDAAGTRSAVGLATANLDTQIGTLATAANLATVAGYIDTEVAAIKAKTDNLPASPAATGDVPSAPTIASAVRTELATELARVDVAASTRLAASSYTAPLTAADVRAAVGLASANLDTQLGDLPTNAELATALAAADDAVLAAIAALNNLSAAQVRTQADDAITAAALATASALATAQTAISAVKAQTDKLTFDANNRVEGNVTAVNDVALTGVGTSGDPWGPA